MLTEEQIFRLMDIANAGCHKGMVTEARTIYDGILSLKPDHVPAMIGQAFSHMVIEEYAEAEEKLRGILADHPDDKDASAALGLCMLLAGRKDDARELLKTLKNTEGPAAQLADVLLEQCN
ncbi:MAG: tetratricopeptide repeat protein [Mailhella sp.]|nr:tetratricopeptide repeat protein [Mailhella sp.]